MRGRRSETDDEYEQEEGEDEDEEEEEERYSACTPDEVEWRMGWGEENGWKVK